MRAVIMVVLAAAPAAAQTPPRDLTTDRPDVTESPFTVPAGRLQVEVTLLGWRRSFRMEGVREEGFEAGTTNLRIGLTRSSELNLVFQSYLTRSGARVPRRSGIGAFDIRGKLNLRGNDDGAFAAALLPYVSLPTDRGNGVSPDYVEGGLLLPLAFELTPRLGLGLNAGVAARRDSADEPYRVRVPLTASFAVSLSDRVGTYYEVAAELTGSGGPAVTLHTGVTWLARDDLQFDAGVNVGVTRQADALAPFLGFSASF